MLMFNIISIIIYTALLNRKDITLLITRVTIITFVIILLFLTKNVYFPVLSKGIGLFNGLFQFNLTTLSLNWFVIIITIVIITLNGFYQRKIINNSVYPIDYTIKNTKCNNSLDTEYINKDVLKISKNYENTTITSQAEDDNIIGKNSPQFKIKEYVLIISFILTGGIFLMSANDLISIFLSIELQSYGLYLLSTIYRESELSTKAGLTYFLLGGLSSCIILLGKSLLYINSGNSSMENIYILSDIASPILEVLGSNNIYSVIKHIPIAYDYYYINLSLIILSAGFMFKISASPFHFWSPDVYDSVPTIVTTFIAIIAKITILIFFLDLVHFTENIYFKSSWINNLLISCLLSLIIGSILGLTQHRIKRLYAYSTINHLGFMLLALSINKLESIQAFIFYIIQYSITNVNAFLLLLVIGYYILMYYNNDKEYRDLKEKNNSPIQLITQLKGFYKINSMISISLTITLLSFLGVPPLIGFFGKQMVLSAAINNGYLFITLIAVLTSVISAVYYLIVIKHIFFDKNSYLNLKEKINNNSKLDNIKLNSHLTVLISILTLITIVYMFIGKIWLNLLVIISLLVFNF
jgi:NADH-ubiquinone oxidoreductase chain 2